MSLYSILKSNYKLMKSINDTSHPQIIKLSNHSSLDHLSVILKFLNSIKFKETLFISLDSNFWDNTLIKLIEDKNYNFNLEYSVVSQINQLDNNKFDVIVIYPYMQLTPQHYSIMASKLKSDSKEKLIIEVG